MKYERIDKNGNIVMFLYSSEDHDIVCSRKWHHIGNNYVAANRRKGESGGRSVLLHREVMRAPDGMVVDHIDGDPTNNVRENLRVITKSDNTKNMGIKSNNTSGYRGVAWSKSAGKWLAKCMGTHIGVFDCKHEAAMAYVMLAKKRYGAMFRDNELGRASIEINKLDRDIARANKIAAEAEKGMAAKDQRIKELEDALAFTVNALSNFFPFCGKDVSKLPTNLDASQYQTCSYDGDKKLLEKFIKCRKLIKREEE